MTHIRNAKSNPNPKTNTKSCSHYCLMRFIWHLPGRGVVHAARTDKVARGEGQRPAGMPEGRVYHTVCHSAEHCHNLAQTTYHTLSHVTHCQIWPTATYCHTLSTAVTHCHTTNVCTFVHHEGVCTYCSVSSCAFVASRCTSTGRTQGTPHPTGGATISE